eukprot:scaffold7244_cov224-Prasinococcus_capsulatus_cf.AAC.1
MSRICKRAEAFFNNHHFFTEVVDRQGLPMHTMEALASSAVRTAEKVRAALILVLTNTGSTARLVAKYRPRVPILAVHISQPPADSAAAAKLTVVRGVIPMVASEESLRLRDHVTMAIEQAHKSGLVQSGDRAVALHKIAGDGVIKIVDVPDMLP